MLIRLLFLCFCGFAFAQAPTQDQALKKAIGAIHERYLDCLKRADARGFSELFSQDGQIMNSGAPTLTGHENIMRDREILFQRAKVIDGAIRTDHLEQSGDLAYELGRFSYTISVDGQPARIVEGKYITIWKRGEDGQWRYRVDAGIPD